MNRIWRMALLIVGIILCDQFSKGAIQTNLRYHESLEIIPNFFNLTYVKNSGVAFGLGAELPLWMRIIFFKVLPSGACIWFLYLVWDARYKSLLQCLGYSMIFAGAVGNLIDRISMDYVVDMFDFYYGTSHFSTFNVADSSISIAAVLLTLDYFLESWKKNKTPPKVI